MACTRAILDDAGVSCAGSAASVRPGRIIAACAERGHADIVLLDTSRLGFFRMWGTPVTLLQ